MKNYLFLLIFLIYIPTISCCKEPEPTNEPDDPPNEEKLDIKWQHLVYIDTTAGYYLRPRFSHDYVVFCSEKLVGSSQNNRLGAVVLDKQSGERHASWDFEPNFAVDAISGFDIGGINNDILIIQGWHYIKAYDLNTGQLKWEDEPDAGMLYSPRLSVSNKYAFISLRSSGVDSWGKLIAFDVESGISKVVFEENWVDGYKFKLEPPSVYYSNNNDTILLFQKAAWDGGWERVDLIAYNLTQDSVYWRNDTIYGTSYEYGSSTLEPNIVGDKFIFQGRKSVHCYDIPSGNLLWKKLYPDEGFAQRRNLCADGKVFMVSETGAIICLDIENGDEVWNNANANAHPSGFGTTMDYYNNRLYLASIPTDASIVPEHARDALKCVSSYTGKVIWSTNEPEWWGYASDGLIIDQNTGYMYFNNSTQIVCTDLNYQP